MSTKVDFIQIAFFAWLYNHKNIIDLFLTRNDAIRRRSELEVTFS